MPTRAGWIVVAGAIAAIGAGRLVGALELYVLGAVALALVVVALAWVRRPAPELAIRREVHPTRPLRGAAARVELVVEHRGGRRSPVVELHDAVEGTVGARLVLAPLAPGAGQRLGYRLPTSRRGRLQVGPLHATTTDPFGLARRRLATAPAQSITILPAIEVLAATPIGRGRQEPLAGLSTRTIAAGGVEDLATLRPYVVGDDLRRVHWPSSARADDLLVRRDEERWQGHLAIVLDDASSAMGPAAFEQAVSAAASLVHAVAEAGDRVRLLTASGSDSGMVDARRAEGPLLEQLAHLPQGAHLLSTPLAHDARTAAIVLLTGPGGPTADELDRHGLHAADTTIVRFEPAAPPAAAAAAGEVRVAVGQRFAEAWAPRPSAGALR